MTVMEMLRLYKDLHPDFPDFPDLHPDLPELEKYFAQENFKWC